MNPRIRVRPARATPTGSTTRASASRTARAPSPIICRAAPRTRCRGSDDAAAEPADRPLRPAARALDPGRALDAAGSFAARDPAGPAERGSGDRSGPRAVPRSEHPGDAAGASGAAAAGLSSLVLIGAGPALRRAEAGRQLGVGPAAGDVELALIEPHRGGEVRAAQLRAEEMRAAKMHPGQIEAVEAGAGGGRNLRLYPRGGGGGGDCP